MKRRGVGHPFKLILFALVGLLLAARFGYSQCVGLPPVSSLGSNKIPIGLCAPVDASLTYNIIFTSPISNGTLDLVYHWGDGTPDTVVPLITGDKKYSSALDHNFPAESDCEYIVTMTIRYKGVTCTNTRQTQKVASWRTEGHNGGLVALISPVTKSTQHIVCEGSPVDVIFEDESEWNCNAQYPADNAIDPIESPNQESRWQQIVYNTGVSENLVPGVAVDGIPVTADDGSSILHRYQDPRGIYHLASPVVVGDPRKRSSLRITAPGGHGSGFPKAGQEFEVTLRYWNFCNPYDDPSVPGPPVDAVNGDHAPVETQAFIKIQAAPAALLPNTEIVCSGTMPSPFRVTGVPANATIQWYANIPGTNEPGVLISSGTKTSLPLTVHPDWAGNRTPGVYMLWASYTPRISGAINCESPKILITRIVREELSVPDPLFAIPASVCNNSTVTMVMPDALSEHAGGATRYKWTGSNGIALSSSTDTTASFKVNVASFENGMHADRTITVTREYATAPGCASSRTFTFRVNRAPVGGTITATDDVCETNLVDTLRLVGNQGKVIRWEMKKGDGPFQTYKETEASTLSPGRLLAAVYTFRAVVSNGPCAEVYSNEETITVSKAPGAVVFAGDDQFLCSSLSSVSLGASSPLPGTGKWSYVSSIPSGLPAPAFSTNLHDPNTAVSVSSDHAGAYTLRWTVSNGACADSDDIVIDFGTDPTVPDAGTDSVVCGPATTLSANVPVKGLGRWSIISGPEACTGEDCAISIVSPEKANSMVALTGAHYRYGTYVLRWTISSGGNNCFVKYDDVVITFDRPSILIAPEIGNVCLDLHNLSPIRLSGSIENSSGGEWVNVSGYGIVSATTLTAGNVNAYYTPSAEDYTRGVPLELKLVAKPMAGSVCTVTEKSFFIPIVKKPVALVREPVLTTCGDTVRLNAVKPADGFTGFWTTDDSLLTFDDPSDPATVLRGLHVSTSIVQWALTGGDRMCSSDPVPVTVNKVSPPVTHNIIAAECAVSPAGTPVASVLLTMYDDLITALPAEKRVITWYRSGLLIANPDQTVPNITDSTVFHANVRDVATACVSVASVTIRVMALPQVQDGILTVCEDGVGTYLATAIDLNNDEFVDAVTTEDNAVVTWHLTENDAMLNESPITGPFSVDRTRSIFARVIRTATEPACPAIARLTIVVNARPSVTVIHGRESFCLSDTENEQWPLEIYQVTPISGARYFWAIEQEGLQIFGGGEEDDFFTMLQFTDTYSGTIRLQVELNGCTSPVIEKNITVSETAVTPAILGPSTVEPDAQDVLFKVTPDNSPSAMYSWEVHHATDLSQGGAFLEQNPSMGSVAVDFQKTDIILTVQEKNTGCSGGIATKQVYIRRPVLDASFEFTPAAACFPAEIATRNTSTGADTYVWTVYDEHGSVSRSNLSDPVFRIVNPGVYSIRLIAINAVTGERDSLVMGGITIFDRPSADFTIRTPVYASGAQLALYNYSAGASDYHWTFGNEATSLDFEPNIVFERPGEHKVTLVASYDHIAADSGHDRLPGNGLVCYDSMTQVVVVLEGSDFEIPNAFTPNVHGPTGGVAMAGGFNDIFLPRVKEAISFRLQIFDRWGSLVYESKDKNNGWDGYDENGKLMPPGAYVYKLLVDLSDGRQVTRMGDVTVIR